MSQTQERFCVSSLRHRVLVWSVLSVLIMSFVPVVSMAQQPTVALSTVSGTILINGQEQREGVLLNSGDVVEVLAGASAVLQMSDGSTLEVSENTKIEVTELRQTVAKARVSRIKLAWGWVRAKLSPEHQEEGSTFSIETPNAVIGVKFSQPDVEVSYSPSEQETIAIAHTMELLAKNLLTGEEMLVPVGSTVIIVGATIKIVAGILAIVEASETGTVGTTAVTAESAEGTTVTGATGTSSPGMGMGTKVAIGIGAAAAAGGVAALTGGSSDDGGSGGSSNIVGRWMSYIIDNESGSILEFFADNSMVEIFDDGDQYFGTWSLQDDQITVIVSVPPTPWNPDDGACTETYTGTVTGDSMQGMYEEECEGGWQFGRIPWWANRL